MLSRQGIRRGDLRQDNRVLNRLDGAVRGGNCFLAPPQLRQRNCKHTIVATRLGGFNGFLVGNGCCRGSLTDPRSELARRLFRRPLYIDVRNLVRDFLPVWRVESTKQDLQDLQVLKAAIRANTKLVWIETPSNPLMKVLD